MGNTDYNQKDVLISDIFKKGQHLVKTSSSTEAISIRKFLDAKVYIKAYDCIKLFSAYYAFGIDFFPNPRVINKLRDYYFSEKNTGINKGNEYFR